MVGHKRPSDGTAGNGLHHRSLDLDEAVRIHEAAERLHQPAALQEDFTHLWVHYEVYITLAIAQFDVG